MHQENPILSILLTSCNKVIHVNNLTKEEDPELKARVDSRLKLLEHLRSCKELYKPKELDMLNQRIKCYITEKEVLEKKLAQVEEELRVKQMEMVQHNTNFAEISRENQNLKWQLKELKIELARVLNTKTESIGTQFQEMNSRKRPKKF